MSSLLKPVAVAGFSVLVVAAFSFFVIWDHRSNERDIQKAALNSVGSPIKEKLSANNENTAGNWTIIVFNFQIGADISSISEILDRFEKEHPNLSIRDYPEIVYYTHTTYVYPHSILIRHDPKLR